MRDDFVFKLGRQPKESDPRTLQLAGYVSAAPAPPVAVDWGSRVADWGMYANDSVGDCAWAAMAHAELLWTSNTSSSPAVITTAQVLGAYSAATGYNPNITGPHGNPTDKGTSLLQALKYWRSTGLDQLKITAFVEIDPHNTAHVQQALDWFGCLYAGLRLPDAVLPASPSSIPPWTVTPDGTSQTLPGHDNDHCVIYSAYDASGLTAVSWGTPVRTSWGFHAAYCEELYAAISPEWTGRGGQTPTGLDLAALTADLKEVIGRGA